MEFNDNQPNAGTAALVSQEQAERNIGVSNGIVPRRQARPGERAVERAARA